MKELKFVVTSRGTVFFRSVPQESRGKGYGKKRRGGHDTLKDDTHKDTGYTEKIP